MNNSRERESSNSGVYDLDSHRSNSEEENHVERIRSLDEIVISLQREKSLADKLSEPGNEYEVKTYIKVNNREWYFSSLVLHNGEEIADDINLIRHEQSRKPVPQTDQTEARWDAFVQDAAKIHLEKCKEVKRRFDRSEKNRWSNEKKILILCGLFLIIAAAVIGTYWVIRDLPVIAPPPTDHSEVDESGAGQPGHVETPGQVQEPSPGKPPLTDISEEKIEEIEKKVITIMKPK